MSSSYTQAHRKIQLHTPLGSDVLLFRGISGIEGISRLFEFRIEALAEREKSIPFEQLIGGKITVTMKMGRKESPSHLNGICRAVSQGRRGSVFTHYSLTVVPELWTLTRRTQSRIFQQKTVRDILKEVLNGLPVDFRLEGSYEPRDYCVQYRESDFNFASRLMEEEGIYYYFRHTEQSHTMVVADTPSGHDTAEGSPFIHEDLDGGVRDEERIWCWEKSQEWRSGRTTLWDHSFEIPHQNLEAQEPVVPQVTAGTVKHKLKLAGNDKFEIYDWPGKFAQRFDGVDPRRGDQRSALQRVFTDNSRTAKIRMEQETLRGLSVTAKSNCRQLRPGHKFKLSRHFNADGEYVIVEGRIEAKQVGDYRSGADEIHFAHDFTCIPFELPYRPLMKTAKPFIPGTQSAVVVGPKGEEIFTDKYGRVKVQFHWDRDGKKDESSSCWIRVLQPVAGRRWGFSFWPRIGQEVIVDFMEGDPDNPVILGVVYNADQMPPYLGDGPDPKHKNDAKVSGYKSSTTLGGQGYNEWRFDDTKDAQQVFLHAERDMDVRVKNDSREEVGHDRHLIVGAQKNGDARGDLFEKVFRDRHTLIKRNQEEKIEGTKKLLVAGDAHTIVQGKTATQVSGPSSSDVEGDCTLRVGKKLSYTITGSWESTVAGRFALESSQEIHLKSATKIVLEAPMVSIKAESGFMNFEPAGVTLQGSLLRFNSGGSPTRGGGASPKAPEKPEEAKPVEPKEADDAVSGKKSA